MTVAKTSGNLLGAGILSAILASSCCIIPALALLAGASGMASSFSWVEPARPYLIGVSIAVLSFSWFQKLRPPKPEVDCCVTEEKPTFIQSKTFLGIITVFALLMIAFPSYSGIFFAKNEKQIMSADRSDIQTVEFQVSGMTCTSCEDHVEHAVNKLPGIIKADASFENENAEIQFDPALINREAIEKAINSTGYIVQSSEIKK